MRVMVAFYRNNDDVSVMLIDADTEFEVITWDSRWHFPKEARGLIGPSAAEHSAYETFNLFADILREDS